MTTKEVQHEHEVLNVTEKRRGVRESERVIQMRMATLQISSFLRCGGTVVAVGKQAEILCDKSVGLRARKDPFVVVVMIVS